MTQYIGENIKKFRQAAGITQEMLAEKMNITAASVSKWERGTAIPDALLFPELAKIFHVSIDDLFGYKNPEEYRSLQEILQQIDEAAEQTDLIAAEEICRNGLKQYPQSMELLCKLAVILKTKFLVSEQKNLEWLDMAIMYCDTIIRRKSDIRLVHTAYKTKAIAQAYKGDKLAALRTAENVIQDHDSIMVYLADGNEKIQFCKKDIEAHLQVIRKMLRLIYKVYRNQGNTENAEKYNNADVSLSINLTE
ncbi:MAG: helix-turn-helix transcriptional regulator [Clostridia bacterium]|nr:helix-turn-helix transcriptional regulator [Clostridia bacterium]